MAIVSCKQVRTGDTITFHSDGIDQYGKIVSCDAHSEWLIIEPTTEHGFHGKTLKDRKCHHIRADDCWLSDFTLPTN